MTPEQMEAEAGRLLVEAARARHERSGPDDAHELRHLFAAIHAGNSDPCRDVCTLDDEVLRRLHDLTYPEWRNKPFAGIPPMRTH
jgi:hypothetical protein